MIAIQIALKDLKRSFRSLFAIGMMLVVPLLITGLLYFAFGGILSGETVDLPTVKVAIANQDQPGGEAIALGQMLVDFFNDERMPTWLVTVEVDNAAAAREAVDQQEAGVAIVIPPDFSASLLHSDESTAAVQLIHDPTLTLAPALVQNLLTQFADGVSGSRILLTTVQDGLAEEGLAFDPSASPAVLDEYSTYFSAVQQNLNHSQTPLIDLNTRSTGEDLTDTASSPLASLMGGIMAGMMVFFVFFSGGYTAMSILQEDEEGTLSRLFTTPVSRSSILGGKFLTVFLTTLVQSITLMVISHFAFGIDWGQLSSISLALVGMVVVTSGFGVLVVSFLKNSRQGGAVLGGVFSVLGMLGGLYSVAMDMPESFDRLSLFTPHGWAMRAWQLSLANAPGQELLLTTGVLIGMGLVFFVAGSLVFNKRYA